MGSSRRFVPCMIGIAMMIAMPATGAEPVQPGWLSPERISYHILRVAKSPDVEGVDPLADAAWQQAEAMGPFFRKGRPEDAAAASTARILLCEGRLYIAVRCLEPKPDGIKAGTDREAIWKDDSIEIVLTQGSQGAYPYAQLQVNAAGVFSAARLLQPFVLGRGPLKEGIDPAKVQVRAGKDGKGWWAVIALPLEELRIGGTTLLGNIVRNRQADGSDAAWCDLWAGSIHNVRRFQPMTIVDALPPAGPRLQMPAGLAVGENRLHWENWQSGYRLVVNDKPVPVEASGDCIVRVKQRGTATVRVESAEGAPLVGYTTEVPRPMLIEAAEPFQQDTSKPVVVNVSLNVAAQPIEVTLQAMQGDKTVGSKVVSLSNGTQTIELPCKVEKPGEVMIIATTGAGWMEIRAEHWCVLGMAREAMDKFREGLAGLPTVGLYRATLADACNYYHVLQAGDGQYRSLGRTGTLRSDEWGYSFVYSFALVYTGDWPENPYHNDPRMLASAIAGMEAGLAPETWYEWVKHPPNRQLQSYLLTYDLLKDKVPADLAEYWRGRLIRMMEAVVDRWITPSTYEMSFFSESTGTGTNHYAYHLANVYTAGKIFGRQDWMDLGRAMMRRLAAHERDGYFPEQRAGVVIHYTWLSSNAVGEYYWQSGDEEVLPHLTRCADFAWRVSLPNNQVVILHDSRNNEASAWQYGDFVLSLTPGGRWLAHERIQRVAAEQRPSRSSPEFWFRTAENAVYFRPGEEKAPPAEYEFAFLDGKAVIARNKTFTYGMSAICPRATDETYRVDQQNVLELNHERAGRILSGANSQQQPEAGSFCRKVKGRTVFLPWEGVIERTATGHAARLEFDTFQAQVTCEVLSASKARVTVQLIKAEGDEPVVYSFFPVAAGAQEFKSEAPTEVLALQGVRIQCSQPVQVERDFKIMDPYSQTIRVRSKPLRAYTTLRLDKPLVLDVTVDESARPASQPAGR